MLAVPPAMFLGDGLGVVAGMGLERAKQIGVCSGKIGLQANGMTQGDDRLIGLPYVRKRRTQIGVCFGEIMLETNCRAVVSDGFVGLANSRQQDAQVVLRLGVIGFELDGRRTEAIASPGCPISINAIPRLLWASAKSGLSRMA